MRIAVNGTRLYLDVDGSGLVPEGAVMRERPTVVLVHGGPGSDHSTFKPIMSGLAEHAQVIYYDHRGMGRSDPASPQEWTLSTWADDLAGLLDALEIEQPFIVGASFGGFVAQAFAIAHPGRLAKLALLCTAPRSDPQLSIDMFRRLGGEAAGEAAARFLLGEPGARDDYMRLCLPHYTVGQLDMVGLSRAISNPEMTEQFFSREGEWNTMDMRPGLGRIRCPTLVLSGELDPIVPAPLAWEIHAAIPEAYRRIHIVEQAGHGWSDKTEEWQSTLKAFLFDA